MKHPVDSWWYLVHLTRFPGSTVIGGSSAAAVIARVFISPSVERPYFFPGPAGGNSLAWVSVPS